MTSRTPNTEHRTPRTGPSFESRLDRLEAIVHELEGDQLELARALELFEEGVECLRAASKELADARSKVQRLVERDDGSFHLTDFRG
jgi:exodeoxyribonuclease VII small subunit